MNAAALRFTGFGVEIDAALLAEKTTLIHKARVTLIEHCIVEALILSREDSERAISELNAQLRVCSQIVDGEGKPLIVPSEHLHPSVWKYTQLVIRGSHLK